MKMHRLVFIFLGVLGACSSIAQGTFQNLGFESATLIAIPGDAYNRVQFAQALPGWTGYIGAVQESAALYNNEFLDSTGLGILGPGWNFGGRIEGNFTAILQAGVDLVSGQPANASLSQTGLIPIGSQSLLFKAQPNSGSSN